MKKIISYLSSLLIVILLLVSGMIVSADTGPKRSVSINFICNDYDEYYVSLLSNNNTGPYYRPDENESSYERFYNDLNNIEKKFFNYVDLDGYYYIGLCKKITKENNEYFWGYYPPDDFKILIYIEEDDLFIISNEVINTYAFHSNYDVWFGVDGITNVIKTTTFTKEIINFFIRVIITLIIEIGIALLFKYRNIDLVIIIIANIVTQIGLNLLLNYNYDLYNMHYYIVVLLIISEILVFVCEGIAYSIIFSIRHKENKKKIIMKAWLYSLTANFMSFVFGYLILLIIGQ